MTTLALALLLGVQAPNEVPFRIADDAIVVDATVNGKKASFMFDTGFSGTVVMNDAINIGASSGAMTLRDFVGEFQARTVPIKTLKIGNVSVDATGMEAVQQPLDHLSESYNTHTDGIMGLEAVSHSVFEINYQNNKFIFHPNSVDISKRKPDNTKTFLLKMLPIGRNVVALQAETAEGKKMTFSLDTGNAFYVATHKEVLERVGRRVAGEKPQYMRTSWVGSGPVDSFMQQMSDVVIYGVPVKSSIWSVIDLPSSSSESDGTVGFGFLKNFNIVLDLERRRVWLERWTDTVENKLVADVGISPAFDSTKKRYRVARVTPNSPAEKAGVKAGDDILSIDGKSVGDVGWRALMAMFEGDKDSKVQLALSRSGNLVRFDVVREYLVNGLSSTMPPPGPASAPSDGQ